MIRVSQAADTYKREDIQQIVNAINELQKLHMLLSGYVAQVDTTTGKNVKMTIANLVATPVEI